MGVIKGIFFLSLSILMGAGCRGGPPLELSPDQTGEWDGRVIRVTGRGKSDSPDPVEDRFLSLKKATEDAHEQLREKIMDIQFDPGRRVRDLIKADGERERRIDLFMKGAKISDVRFFPQKGMEVDAELRLGELFKRALTISEKKPAEKTAPPPPP